MDRGAGGCFYFSWHSQAAIIGCSIILPRCLGFDSNCVDISGKFLQLYLRDLCPAQPIVATVTSPSPSSRSCSWLCLSDVSFIPKLFSYVLTHVTAYGFLNIRQRSEQISLSKCPIGIVLLNCVERICQSFSTNGSCFLSAVDILRII